MNRETRKAIEKEVSRLIPQAIYEIKKTYKDGSGYLTLQDFFLAVPFQVNVEVEDADEMNMLNGDVYPSVLKYLGGYTKLVTDDADSKYLKVFITVTVPGNIESLSDGVAWVDKNILEARDIPGSTMLLMIYMHEIMHIMHKHLMPSVNAKFDAIIKQHSDGSNIPVALQHKIKNFAEDFIINAMLIENAADSSSLTSMKKQASQGLKKLAFLYNPELSPANGHTVETVIVELMKNVEIEQDGNSGGGGQCSCGQQGGNGTQNSGNQGNQSGQGGTQSNSEQDNQDGGTQNNGDQDSGSNQGTQNNGGQCSCDQQGGQGNSNQGTTYKIQYGDFEYMFKDNHQQGNDNGSDQQNGGAQDVSQAVRDAMNQVANKFKGAGSAHIAAQLGLPVTVSVDWLEKLESDLFKEVRHRTHKVSSTWSRLKNKYRHVAPLPATVNYENVLNAVIVIDQSGSMGDLELRKINYIIKKLVKRVKSLRVLIHDSDVVYDKTFVHNIDKAVESEIFSKRHAAGGTSHGDAFNKIEEEYIKKSNEDFIVLVFSDMYSDIEEIWDSYHWTQTTKTYLVCTDVSGIDWIKNVPATVIDMETGEKL